jgi:hypothetical protein
MAWPVAVATFLRPYIFRWIRSALSSQLATRSFPLAPVLRGEGWGEGIRDAALRIQTVKGAWPLTLYPCSPSTGTRERNGCLPAPNLRSRDGTSVGVGLISAFADTSSGFDPRAV